jgi:lipopolysaccharide transport system permease protein
MRRPSGYPGAVEAEAMRSPALERTSSRPRATIRIQPSRGLIPVDVAELWRYRALAWFFVLRDAKGRYRQTFLGPAWAIIRPLMTIVIFSAVFGGLAGISTGSDIPYPLFVTPAVLAMNYFSSALTGAGGSLLASGGLISKVYFPRLYAPLSAALTPLIDFGLALVVLFGLFVYYHRAPSWQLVFLPAFLVFAALVAIGFGMCLAGPTVRYRDVTFALPFVLQIWMYVTPVLYPVSFVPPEYRWLLALNPLTAVVEGFRWSLLGTPFGDTTVLYVSLGLAVVVAAGGLFMFRRAERTIVDMI